MHVYVTTAAVRGVSRRRHMCCGTYAQFLKYAKNKGTNTSDIAGPGALLARTFGTSGGSFKPTDARRMEAALDLDETQAEAVHGDATRTSGHDVTGNYAIIAEVAEQAQAEATAAEGGYYEPLAPRIAARAEMKMAALEAELSAVKAELSKMKGLDDAKTKRIKNSAAQGRKVNAWTQWGQLKEIVVGVADHACFIPPQPAEQPAVNTEGGSGATEHKGSGAGKVIEEELKWPSGPKKQETIDAANAQLDNLAATLEGRGIRVMRPDASIDWNQPLKTPFFEVPHQYCSTCGRDSIITLGNIMLEAAMSRRDRHFEVLAFRDIIGEMRTIDPDCMWKAAPRPTLRDSMYNDEWWGLSLEERYDRMHAFEFCITEDEPIFDAADITRCGKDIFVQLSKSCNKAGIHWLKQELAPHGFRVHTVRFPYDLAPSHLDCTFVPLRPGLVLTNPERPILEEDAQIFKRNGWRFVDAPLPQNAERPWASQSSKWLSMNVLVIGPNEVVCEAEETPLHKVLSDEGFEVIPVPFRDVYEFGGGLHCATWDLTRDDKMDDFFPIQ